MKIEHTPGKWSIMHFELDDEIIISEDPNVHGNIICESPSGKTESMQYWKANAKLIAAAPELLEALLSLKDIAENGGSDKKGQAIHPEMFSLIADKAIKKATE